MSPTPASSSRLARWSNPLGSTAGGTRTMAIALPPPPPPPPPTLPSKPLPLNVCPSSVSPSLPVSLGTSFASARLVSPPSAFSVERADVPVTRVSSPSGRCAVYQGHHRGDVSQCQKEGKRSGTAPLRRCVCFHRGRVSQSGARRLRPSERRPLAVAQPVATGAGKC